MAARIVPTRSGVPSWTQRTTLDGSTYTLAFLWNQRASFWTISIADEDESPILSGRALVTGSMLLRRLVDPRRPAGDLILVDTLNADGEPGLDDLGSRFVLVYLDAETVEAAREAQS